MDSPDRVPLKSLCFILFYLNITIGFVLSGRRGGTKADTERIGDLGQHYLTGIASAEGKDPPDQH